MLFGLKDMANKCQVDTDKENATGAKNVSNSRCRRPRSASSATASVAKQALAQVSSNKSAAVVAHETQLGGQLEVARIKVATVQVQKASAETAKIQAEVAAAKAQLALEEERKHVAQRLEIARLQGHGRSHASGAKGT
jgi:hypothetical protein